ncbi:MAG: hypothetical protein AAF497_05270, partial [Planctomycetota bacterium]
GIAPGIPFIELLLTAEMTTGVLVGFHDNSAIQGTARLDFASDGESFEGARSHIVCKPGELVLRDEGGIIGSYFRGPDNRTAIAPSSTDVAVFYFDAPGITESALLAAVDKVHEYLGPASGRISE